MNDNKLKLEMNKNDFVFFGKKNMNFIIPSEWEIIKKSFYNLPYDPYAKEKNRVRCFQFATFIPWQNKLIYRPVSSYYQSDEYNTEEKGKLRTFEPLSEELKNTNFLKELIQFDFNLTNFDSSSLNAPIDVGIHFIRTISTSNMDGTASPNRLHKDGEPYTFVHLIERNNIVEGETIITDNNKNILVKETLNKELESFGFFDEKVFHHITPIKIMNKNKEIGSRSVILIDFTPLVRITDS